MVTRIALAARRENLVLISAEAWQLLEERHHGPDPLIVVRLAPRRHSAHFHSVFDDPERLRRIRAFHLCQIGRLRIQSLSDL